MPELAKYFFAAICGSVVTGIGAYIVLARDVSYIKGQLTMVLERLKQLDKLFEKIGEIERDGSTRQRDIDAAHEKLRELRRAGM